MLNSILFTFIWLPLCSKLSQHNYFTKAYIYYGTISLTSSGRALQRHAWVYSGSNPFHCQNIPSALAATSGCSHVLHMH